jgi:hypothetical protein
LSSQSYVFCRKKNTQARDRPGYRINFVSARLADSGVLRPDHTLQSDQESLQPEQKIRRAFDLARLRYDPSIGASAAESPAPPQGQKLPRAATRYGQAAWEHQGRSITGRVHQVYGGIPQTTCLPLKKRATALSRHEKMAALRPDRKYDAAIGFPYRLIDHSDDRTAGASAENRAAGWLGLRKRSSPSDAASGSPRPNNSNREAKLTATTERASGRVMN